MTVAGVIRFFHRLSNDLSLFAEMLVNSSSYAVMSVKPNELNMPIGEAVVATHWIRPLVALLSEE